MAEHTVSVIMPARDAAAHLPRSLPPVLAPGEGAAEVIVVDDGSVDDTAEQAGVLGARVVRLESPSGPSRARNAGVTAARGDLLCFVDADVVLHPGAIRRMAAQLDGEPGIAAVFGSYDAAPAAGGLVTRYRNLLHHYVHQTGDPDAETFWAGCGAIRREAFEAVGGFDAEKFPFSIEDIELGYRLKQAGYRIRLDRAVQGTHLKALPLLQSLRTDIFGRAMPWARLNLERRHWPRTLNIRTGRKLATLLACAVPAAAVLAVLHPAWLVAAAICLLLVVRLNADLFNFLRQQGGWRFALACVPLRVLHYFCAVAGLAAAWLRHYLKIPVRDANRT